MPEKHIDVFFFQPFNRLKNDDLSIVRVIQQQRYTPIQ
jgi:hypothetical protein